VHGWVVTCGVMASAVAKTASVIGTSACRLGKLVILLQDAAVPGHRRRPQWRGERQAVMVRLPKEVAEQLRASANQQGVSLSDAAAAFIATGLKSRRDAA
jgi:predicted HicB family RNase H-like nuclease